MSWIFKDEPPKPVDAKTARNRALLLASPFAVLGLVALVMFLHDAMLGGMSRKNAFTTLSFVAVCGGIVAMVIGVNAKKIAITAAIKSATYKPSEKPWLDRPDWATGHIPSDIRRGILLLWLFTFFWNAVSAPIVFIGMPAQLHQGNYAILFALLFPIAGITMILYALKTTLALRKFNRSIFELAAVPGSLGGVLQGKIQVKARLQPQHGWHLRLSSIRRTTTGTGKNPHTKDKILWQDEKWLRPGLPQTDSNATGIPVYFKLPANLPESTPRKGDGIYWRLEALAKLGGPNFHAAFDVPVFKLPETPVPTEDPAAQYQMSLDEMRKQIRSRIQVNDLSGDGKEFVFPAAPNTGVTAILSVIWVVFTGVVLVLVWHRDEVPLILPAIIGFFDLLLTAFAFDLLFRWSRATVTSQKTTAQTGWLFFKQERSFASSEITGFSVEQGMTVGHQAYYDLKIRLGGDNNFTVAKNIADKPEADWLVQQMSAEIRKQPSTTSQA